jgi:OFA family oxalate/formate antiporter-like MFS transporter
MKKWIVLTAGVISQTAMGGIYAWSTFVPHLKNGYGLTGAQSGLIFGIMIAAFTLATIPAGRVLIKAGPRITAGIGAVLFAGGYIIASFSGGSYPVLIAGLGLTAGIGIGFGYVCPLTIGMKWFPNRKGLVTGVAVAGFGMGAILLSAIAESLLRTMDVLTVFRITGIILGLTAFTAAMLLAEPPASNSGSGRIKTKEKIAPYLFSRKFIVIWIAMFAGTFAGLLISGNLKPLKLNLGLSDYSATLAISLFAVGNTVGRLVWGQVHDRYGSKKTILVSLAVLLFALLPLLFVTKALPALSVAALIGFGFGACFVVYASSIVEVFGIDFLPRLYPICFLSYGAAALLGPTAGGWTADLTGSYTAAVIICAAVILIALGGVYKFFPAPGKVPASAGDRGESAAAETTG